METNTPQKIRMNGYIVTVSSDVGIFRLRVTAGSQESAREMVIRANRCPKHAIVAVRNA